MLGLRSNSRSAVDARRVPRPVERICALRSVHDAARKVSSRDELSVACLDLDPARGASPGRRDVPLAAVSPAIEDVVPALVESFPALPTDLAVFIVTHFLLCPEEFRWRVSHEAARGPLYYNSAQPRIFGGSGRTGWATAFADGLLRPGGWYCVSVRLYQLADRHGTVTPLQLGLGITPVCPMPESKNNTFFIQQWISRSFSFYLEGDSSNISLYKTSLLRRDGILRMKESQPMAVPIQEGDEIRLYVDLRFPDRVEQTIEFVNSGGFAIRSVWKFEPKTCSFVAVARVADRADQLELLSVRRID